MIDLVRLLEQVRAGEVVPVEAARLLESAGVAATQDACVDIDRARRCGYPEVVYARGKSSAAIAEVFRALVAHDQEAFATLVSPEQARDLLGWFPEAEHNPLARTIRVSPTRAKGAAVSPTGGHVAVITAGTSDRPVAEEALETVRWMGCTAELIFDVGVAGPQRLPQQKHRFAHADAIVVVAGMEGALPSVVGGHVDCPVIAVPTSVGYGANLGGIAALLSMLNSCAANVCVVNIDAGFKGGFVAGLIARRARQVTSDKE